MWSIYETRQYGEYEFTCECCALHGRDNKLDPCTSSAASTSFCKQQKKKSSAQLPCLLWTLPQVCQEVGFYADDTIV